MKRYFAAGILLIYLTIAFHLKPGVAGNYDQLVHWASQNFQNINQQINTVRIAQQNAQQDFNNRIQGIYQQIRNLETLLKDERRLRHSLEERLRKYHDEEVFRLRKTGNEQTNRIVQLERKIISQQEQINRLASELTNQ